MIDESRGFSLREAVATNFSLLLQRPSSTTLLVCFCGLRWRSAMRSAVCSALCSRGPRYMYSKCPCVSCSVVCCGYIHRSGRSFDSRANKLCVRIRLLAQTQPRQASCRGDKRRSAHADHHFHSHPPDFLGAFSSRIALFARPALSPEADSRFLELKWLNDTWLLFLAITAPFFVPVNALRSYLPVFSSRTPVVMSKQQHERLLTAKFPAMLDCHLRPCLRYTLWSFSPFRAVFLR